MADDNQKLNARIAELSAADNSFTPSRVSEDALISANPPALAPEPAEAQPVVDASSYETTISQLTRRNRQLSEANSDFQDQNRLLNRQLASLEGQADTKLVSDEGRLSAPVALPAIPTAATTVAGNKSGWGVLKWVIPFLALGLGIAFFVIIREELHRPPAAKTNNPARKN